MATPGNENTILCVFGVKGSGKTTLVQEIVRSHSRVVIFDTVGQYGGDVGAHVTMGLGPGARALLVASSHRSFRVSLRARETDELLKLLEIAYEVPDTLVVVEEASFFCSPSFLPFQLSQLVRLGRHRRISQIYVAQRPSEVHRAITAQSDVIASFRQREDRDLAFLKSRFGPRGIERLRTLPRFKVLAAGDLSKAPIAVVSRIPEGENALDTVGDEA